MTIDTKYFDLINAEIDDASWTRSNSSSRLPI